MKCPRRRWLLIPALGTLLILAIATRQQTLPLLAEWLDVGGPLQKADAVVLLNGGMNTRPFVAAALVHGGWAPQILLNTVADHANQRNGMVPTYFDISIKVLGYGGVPEDRIVRVESAAETTFDEAKAVADYLADHPAKRLMIVTDGPHTRRSRWIFQRVLADRPVEITMISVPIDEFENSNWWRSEVGFLFVVSEYFKLFFYGLRYGRLGYELAGGAAIIALICAWFWRRRQLSPSGAA